MCFLLLGSLPPSWDTLVIMASNTIGNKFKLQDVIASLANEETRNASSQLSDKSSQPLVTGDRGRSQHRDQSSGFNRGRSQSKGRSKSQGRKVTSW